jgi:hypothetical protein
MVIKKALKEITESINNGKLVVFVGAGVSKNYGYPNWDELTDKIIKELNLEKHSKLINDIERCKKTVINKNKNVLLKATTLLGYSSDEYLLYAQYLYEYFIKEFKEKDEKKFEIKGQKKFTETIKKILEDKKGRKCKIIPKIFDLNPQHIITTNYDTLLEDYGSKNYELIVQNSNLAKTKSNNYIIKMHGDFKHNNIVLKESDYHNYSENFKLIDNFLKSIIATHTLLFVGFSAADPNFKQIYAWISRTLKKNTRKAFFINLEKENFDIYKTKYFENKYIYIIHFEDLREYHKDSVIIEKKGHRLEYCLDKINKSYIDKFLDSIYILKTSTHPIVWGFEEMLKNFGATISYYESYNELRVKNTVLHELFLKPTIYEKDERVKLLHQFLYSVLGKRGQILLDDKKIEITEYSSVPKRNNSIHRELKLLTEFNYYKLEKLLQNYPKILSLSNHIRFKRKAYLLTMMSKNDEAYDILSELLIFYKKRKMYFEYFNTGFDRNFTRSYYTGKMEYFDFEMEMKKISLNDRIKLSNIFVSIKQRLYYLEKIEDSIEITNEIIDLVEFYNRGGIQNSSLIERLIFIMDDTFKILYDEGICSNYSKLFKYNLKSYFISFYTKYNIDKVDERLDHFFGGLSTVTELEFNYLYYATQFLNPKDWNNILNYSEQNLELSNYIKKEMIYSFQNISNYILQKKTWTRNTTNFFGKRLCNFIILFSKTSMEITKFTQIIEIISLVIFKFDVYKYSEYLKKLCDKHKKHFVSENSEKLKPLFINMIRSLENEKHLTLLSDFRSILDLFENVNFKKKLSINNKGINNIESLIENERAIFEKCIGINMLISMYYNCSKNMKIKLANYMQNFFKDNFKKTSNILHFYLCLHKAIKKNIIQKTEESLFISKMLKYPLSEKDENFVVYLDTIYQLKKINKVKQKDINKYLSKYSKSSTSYRALLFKDNFTIPKTELKARWLLHLVDNQKMLLEFIKNYNLDYKELIMKVNTEILLKENNKNKEKYRELLEFLLKHIND